jgi:hypothetical protein
VCIIPAEFGMMEEDMAELGLGPKDAIFEKPDDSVKHLKPLYMRGHIDGVPISRMLMDGGSAVNMMPYSLFKRLGEKDHEALKINLTLNGVGATLWRPRA